MTEASSTAAVASAHASVTHVGDVADRPIGLREKHKRRTRAAIRAAAMELFDAQGYAQTTVAQIAEAAEVSHTTFFRYFQSKEQVVVSDDLDEVWQDALTSIPPGLGRFDLLRAMVRTLVGLVLADDWASDPARMNSSSPSRRCCWSTRSSPTARSPRPPTSSPTTSASTVTAGGCGCSSQLWAG